MKNLSKIMALVLAVMMVLGVATAMAAPADTTLNVTPVAGHSYTAYQLFVGDLSTDKTTLSNVKWGSDVKTIEITYNGTSKVTPVVGGDVPQAVLDYFAGLNGKTSSDNAQATADIISAFIDTSKEGTILSSANTTVKTGYYVVDDTITDATAAGNSTVSTNVVQIVGPTTIAPKAGTVTSEKHVDDQNDSNAEDHSELKDSADYDIGDQVPYTLTFTLPADYASYETYFVSFVDDMSAGLTYDGNAKIWYGNVSGEGEDITFTQDTEAESEYTNGKVYKATISDLKTQKSGLAGGTVLTIKYTATLNANAVIGSTGNPNEYQVEYSRNPNKDGSGEHGTTPWDVNIVFTYKTVFNKVQPKTTGEGTDPLTGADFKLEKKVGESWVDVTALHTGEGAINPTKTGDKTGSTFTFSGLDAGDYKLTETETPNGFNSIDPIEFTITATHVLESNSPTLSTLTGANGTEFTMTAVVSEGKLEKDILNQKGATLPSTGGVGTTMFYVGGGLLALIAVVLLVTKRRVGSAE